jgi:hypothetical protein
MDVILISFSICVLGVIVTVLLFSIAMRPGDEEVEPSATRKLSAPSEGFFLEEVADQTVGPEAPTNSLLLELERHVRMEQEAAKVFLRGPNPESLHAPSDSPLWH